MPENEYTLLAAMLTDLQQAVSDLHVKVARLEVRCGWMAALTGLLGGAIPILCLIAMHYLFPGSP